MSYKYTAAPTPQPPQPPHRTPIAQACPRSAYSYEPYVVPNHVTAAPTKASTPPPIQQRRTATPNPMTRVPPGVHTTQETRTPNHPKTVSYLPAPVCYNRPSRRSDTPAPPTSKSGKSSPPLRGPSLSYSSGSAYGDSSSSPRTPETTSLVPEFQIVSPEDVNNLKSWRNSPLASTQHHATHSQIKRIVYDLNCCVLTFQRPLDLDFEPISLSAGVVPKLARTEKNRPLREQNQKLMHLQEKLDCIQLHGDKNVQKAQEEARAQVGRALEDLRWLQTMIFNKVSSYSIWALSKITMLTPNITILALV
ncbi:hypothetical protein BDV93DRAFT_579464 [Ceratobasidium sp. AG-I]|nr:hypothetical protein BDV93DRAFT_579464 [Ceratobasidium sp. AG-I]